jgi:hypothetical protein
MSRKNNAPIVRSGRGDVGRNVYDAYPLAPERGKTGLLSRRRNVPELPRHIGTCPACGLRIRDMAIAQLGFCDRCREFTGMCGAGRRIICPDVLTRTTWHTPCTELGTVAWEITQAQVQGRCRTVLCRVHDAQLRFAPAPWIKDAVPLDSASRGGRRGS